MPTIEESIELIKKAMPGMRTDGTPMYLHSVRIYESLKEYGFSEDVQYAGLLHDIVEDSDYSLAMLKEL